MEIEWPLNLGVKDARGAPYGERRTSNAGSPAIGFGRASDLAADFDMGAGAEHKNVTAVSPRVGVVIRRYVETQPTIFGGCLRGSQLAYTAGG